MLSMYQGQLAKDNKQQEREQNVERIKAKRKASTESENLQSIQTSITNKAHEIIDSLINNMLNKADACAELAEGCNFSITVPLEFAKQYMINQGHFKPHKSHYDHAYDGTLYYSGPVMSENALNDYMCNELSALKGFSQNKQPEITMQCVVCSEGEPYPTDVRLSIRFDDKNITHSLSISQNSPLYIELEKLKEKYETLNKKAQALGKEATEQVSNKMDTTASLRNA